MKAARIRRIGTLVRGRRQAAGLSKRTLAHWAGIHPTTLTNVEQGLHLPHEKTLMRLGKALGCDLLRLALPLERGGGGR